VHSLQQTAEHSLITKYHIGHKRNEKKEKENKPFNCSTSLTTLCNNKRKSQTHRGRKMGDIKHNPHVAWLFRSNTTTHPENVHSRPTAKKLRVTSACTAQHRLACSLSRASRRPAVSLPLLLDYLLLSLPRLDLFVARASPVFVYLCQHRQREEKDRATQADHRIAWFDPGAILVKRRHLVGVDTIIFQTIPLLPPAASALPLLSILR